MFSRPCKEQPRQAPESQAWILPVFVEKGDLLADLEADLSGSGVSGLGVMLSKGLARFFKSSKGRLPAEVTIHPILAAAHCCWANAKTIAVHEWAKRVQSRAHAAGRTIVLEERPCRGSVRVRDIQTGEILATFEADASFPVDGTGMAIQLLMDNQLF
jgi:hypothetical protein